MAKRKLRLWEALALSLGLMGPTLAMAGNGQGIIGTVGKAVPWSSSSGSWAWPWSPTGSFA